MGPRIHASIGGSQCVQAQPAGSQWHCALLTTKNPGPPIYGPRIRVSIGGSKWLSALPTGGSKWLSALPTGGSQWHRALPGYLPMKRSYWACLMARTFFSPSFSHCARYSSQVASMSCWPQIQRAMESLM